MARLPPPPKDAGPDGRRLWRSVLAEFEISGADLEVLRQAVVTCDQLAALEPVRRLGPFMTDPNTGLPRTNPAYVEHRHQALVLARLLASIQVVGEVRAEAHDPSRPQKRAGVRGVYGKLRAVE